jgi:hypothetical protein
MKPRSVLITLALLVAIAFTVIAATNSGIQSIDRKGSHVRIDNNADIRIEPTSGQGTIASGKTVVTSLNYCADAGSTDTYACSLTPAITAYTTGQVVYIKANTANTGAATLNLNLLGAKSIKKTYGGVTTTLGDNDIRAGQVVGLVYDGTNFQMLSAAGNAYTGGDVVGPASATDGGFVQFDSTTGKLLKGGLTLDTDGTFAANSDTRIPSQKAVATLAATKQNTLTNPIVGVASGYKIARGVDSITGSGTVATGLTTVVSVVVSPQSDPDGTNLHSCSGTIGDQSGTPAAGSVIVKCWKITAAGNGALIAATAAKSVNWIAVGN